ncbi:ABC transporter ATP-binding protein [Crocosphaera chwakensis]|uniref:Polysialic acid transport ATP-binding protein KpsT n=1 Tax=Crocosphaera chwakensis CCY0110 TaxID=391612 RepID=A3ISL9_9CHRO|nr:ABC transporter ATP-binding protein [Crocosphaera chwakensis]EAZ90589.1 polysialic acid transport ATP-binding protein; KpsT [Crocosphaera chwakensis CCY0110]
MADEVLVKVDHVSKKFCRDLKRSLWYGVQDIMSEVTAQKYEHELREDEFWSVNDISFELRRGECLGLIGPNGAGKSTLLKILNGLIKPDKGRIELRGRIGALIELSAGFNAILTGRENIYSRGAVLGFTKEEIDKKLDAIIDFSELEDFIDTPVVNYSSGMKVRLGFAVAAQMEPDVLLLDEVLAVGDVGFRAKCFNSIYKMMENAAVILVSHSMPQINRVCSDILVMNHGQPVFQGKDVPRGIDKFYTYFEKGDEGLVMGNGKAVINQIELESNGKKEINSIKYLDELILHINFTVDASIDKCCLNVVILNQELQNIVQCNSLFHDFEIPNLKQEIRVKLSLGEISLNPAIYSISVGINSISSHNTVGDVLYKNYSVKKFKVVGDFFGYAPMQLPGKWEILC